MRTVQILQQICDNILQNPSIASQMPWEDIKVCILTELDDRRILYSNVQYSSICTMLQSKFSQLDFANSIGDYSALIKHLSEIIFGLQLLPNNDDAWDNYYRKNFAESCLRHHRENTIIVLGDSHVNFFGGNELLSFLPIGNDINTCTPTDLANIFTPLHLGPCLAYTCNNAQSSFNFRKKAEYLCDHFIKPDATVICTLGEIDLRVHVFQQTLRQQKTYQEIVDDILTNYFSFLLQLKEKNYNLYVWGPIASQSDDCPVDPNFPRNGSEEDRNKATAYFNQQLSAFCSEQGIGFLSVFEQMITPDFKTRTEYLSTDRCHLGQSALPIAKTEWEKINHPKFHNNPL